MTFSIQRRALVQGPAAAGLLSAFSLPVLAESLPAHWDEAFDVVIVGSGFAAWTDREHRREKLNLGEDSEARHRMDTLKGGDFFNDPALVDVLVKNAPAAMDWMLEEGGLMLNKGLGRVGGHTAYRGPGGATWTRSKSSRRRRGSRACGPGPKP